MLQRQTSSSPRLGSRSHQLLLNLQLLIATQPTLHVELILLVQPNILIHLSLSIKYILLQHYPTDRLEQIKGLKQAEQG